MTTRLVTVILLLCVLVSGGPAAAAPDCEVLDVGPDGCLTITGWSTSVDEENLILYRVAEQGLFEDAVGAWTALLTPYCRGNLSGDLIIGQDMCQAALATCEIRGSDAEVAMWMVLQPILGGPSRVEGPVCFGGALAVPIGPQIQELVEAQIGAQAPPIVLQPADAIVNLPMIASTDPRPPIVIEVTDPIAGTAQATPEFTWSFGADAVGYGPGLPYDGTSPTAHPDYYLTHTYGALGQPAVALTVTWQVTFTIPGYPPVELTDVVRTATTSTQVRAAGSELVGD